MATFRIPAGAFEHVTPLGATPPAAGYYPVKITKVEDNSKDKTYTRRVHCQFENGFSMFEFLHTAFDAEGEVYPGLDENQVSGRLAALMTVLNSVGFTREDLNNGEEYSDDRLIFTKNGGRKAYVEFIPGQRGVPGSYSTIRRFVTPEVYEANKDVAPPPVVAPASVSSAVSPRTGMARAPAPAGMPVPQISAAQNLTR